MVSGKSNLTKGTFVEWNWKQCCKWYLLCCPTVILFLPSSVFTFVLDFYSAYNQNPFMCTIRFTVPENLDQWKLFYLRFGVKLTGKFFFPVLCCVQWACFYINFWELRNCDRGKVQMKGKVFAFVGVVLRLESDKKMLGCVTFWNAENYEVWKWNNLILYGENLNKKRSRERKFYLLDQKWKTCWEIEGFDFRYFFEKFIQRSLSFINMDLGGGGVDFPSIKSNTKFSLRKKTAPKAVK